jgi:hypothetical protein
MGVEKILERGAIIITVADSSVSLENDSSPINVLSNIGQIITAVFSKSPGGTIAFAPGAAVVTTGKIITDAQNGQTISAGDILSVTGNAIAIIGTVGALISTAPVTVPAAALGLVLAGLGALSNTEYGSSKLEKLRNYILDVGYAGSSSLGDNYDSLDISTGNLQNSINKAQTTPIIFTGTNGGVTTIGTNGSVIITGTSGDDTITGTSGDDIINPGLGYDTVDGGAGDDLLIVDYSSNTFTGTSPRSGMGYTSLFGNGNGLFFSRSYENGDTIGYHIKFDNIERLQITGTVANDAITGGDGDDTINAGLGEYNRVRGGAGNDLLIVDYSSNTYTGTAPQAGIYSSVYSNGNGGFNGGYSVYSNGNGGFNGGYSDFFPTSFNYDGSYRNFFPISFNTLDSVGFSNIERFQITGTGANDNIITGDGNDTINAGDGDDTINAGDGDDTINGGAGNDNINGVNPNNPNPGKGEIDTLTGGAGSDKFILGDINWIAYDDGLTNNAGTSDYAKITDFNPDDVIQLHGSSSDYLLTVSGANTNLYINKPGTEPDELIAILENRTGLSLTGSYFSYIGGILFFNYSGGSYFNYSGSGSIAQQTFTDPTDTANGSNTVLDLVSASINEAPVTSFNNGKLAKIADDIFNIFDNSGKSKLQVTLMGRSSNFVNELGTFTVDDAQGNINGIAPGAAGYAQAALDRTKVVFSAIANLPNGFNTNNLTHLLEFNSGENLKFYLVKNSSTDAIRAGVTPLTDILFSDPLKQKITDLGSDGFSLAWKDKDGNSTADFKDLVVKIQSTNNSLPLGTNLQGKSQGEMIDLRGVTSQVKADFVVNREAAFNNFIGFYQVTDENGGIDFNGDGKADIFAGQAGYIEAAIRGRVAGIDLTVNNQGTATYTGTFQPGSIFAPFIIVDGRPEALLDSNPNNNPAVYFPFLGANADKVDHIRLLGNNVFGFEDLPSGGDKDFNDVIVRVNLSIA